MNRRFAISLPKALSAVAVSLALSASMFALAACGSTDGKSLYESKCGSCHPLATVESANYQGADQWKPVVERMKAMTTTISDSDAETITEYLGSK